MNTQFDELTKNLAQSVTRRGALKKFGVGLAGMALACFGLANKAHADSVPCRNDKDCRRLGPAYVCCAARASVCIPYVYCIRWP